MESLPDKKVFSYLLKGPTEFNNVQRVIDFSLLTEAAHYDFKPLARIIKAYHNQYRTPPPYNLLRDNLIEDYDTLQMLDYVEEEDCKEAEVKFYVDLMRRRYNGFLARKLAEATAEDGEEFDHEEYNSELGKIQSKIERLYKNAVFTEGNVKESVDERLGRYLYTEENPDEITGVFLGYKDLDHYCWGIKDSELLVISGASSSGKSLLMMNIAINAWLGSNNPLDPEAPIIDDGKNILFFSLEMSKPQLEQRLDSNLANIVTNHLTRGKLELSEKERYFRVLDFCRKYEKQFYICDMPRGSKTLDIEARYDAISSEFTPELVCVDYLGIMKPNVSRNSDWLDVGYTAEDLHEFCRAKNIPVVTAAQRKSKDKKSKKQYNDLEELGRSKMIGDNANIVFLIENREDEHLMDDMIVHVVKNRSGAKGKVTLLKNFETARVESLPDDWAGDTGDENII
jgi:replicative DNA helicase